MSLLWKKLLRATGLTRTGKLEDATREIQRALGGLGGPEAGRDGRPAPRPVDASFDPPAPPAGDAGRAPASPVADRTPSAAPPRQAPASPPAPSAAPAPPATSPSPSASASASAPSAASAPPATPAPSPPPAPSAPPSPSPWARPDPAPSASSTGVDTAPPHAADPDLVLDAGRPPGRFLDGRAATPFGTRDFKLHVPGGDAASLRHRPLVVLLHGCKQDPDDFARGTGMNRLADQLGAYVLYPAQAPRSNAMRCWNWFQPQDQARGAGEPALLATMVADVVREHVIDPDRVYVAGLSAGGAMAAILARRYPDVFAAAGIHSGLAPGAARDVASAFQAMSAPRPSTPVADPAGAPLVVFQGDADTTVHPANARQLVGSLLGAAPTPATEEAGEAARGALGWTRSVFRDPADAAGPSRAELWLVQGLGHAWSGGSPTGSYTDAAGPDASRAMLRFFLAHPRRHPPSGG